MRGNTTATAQPPPTRNLPNPGRRLTHPPQGPCPVLAVTQADHRRPPVTVTQKAHTLTRAPDSPWSPGTATTERFLAPRRSTASGRLQSAESPAARQALIAVQRHPNHKAGSEVLTKIISGQGNRDQPGFRMRRPTNQAQAQPQAQSPPLTPGTFAQDRAPRRSCSGTPDSIRSARSHPEPDRRCPACAGTPTNPRHTA